MTARVLHQGELGGNIMPTITLKTMSSIAACLFAAVTISPALAQQPPQQPQQQQPKQPAYPTRAITVVVPFPAGGPSDVIARIVVDHMSKTLKQKMIIENVAGAGGTTGSARVAAAASDGYTLLAGSMGSHVSAPVLTPGIKYNSEKDFVPVGFTAHAPAVIVARKDIPAKNLQEFVKYLQTNGNKVKQGHGGIGASSHMACFLFNSVVGAKPTSVAYRGSAPALNDVVAGHIDYLCEQAVSVAGAVTGNTVRALAVSSNTRLATMPDVPTAKEAGINYQMSIWAGIFAPKGTSRTIVTRLSGALSRALEDPMVQKRMADLGGSIPTKEERSPQRFEKFVMAEIAHWSPILKAAQPKE